MNIEGVPKRVLEAITDYRREHFTNPPGEILISLPDAQQMLDDWRDSLEEKFRPKEREILKDGAQFSLWGLPSRALAQLPSGHALVNGKDIAST